MSNNNESAKKLSAKLFAAYETERAMKWLHGQNKEFAEKYPAGTPQPEQGETYWIIKNLLNIISDLKATSPRDWTPCAEGNMPEDDTNFCAWMQLEATIDLNGRYSTRTVGRFYVPLVGIWAWADGWTCYPTETGITADKANIGNVIAWRYPTPYNPDHIVDANKKIEPHYRADQKEDNADDHK